MTSHHATEISSTGSGAGQLQNTFKRTHHGSRTDPSGSSTSTTSEHVTVLKQGLNGRGLMTLYRRPSMACSHRTEQSQHKIVAVRLENTYQLVPNQEHRFR